ncbi:class I adenylate-forming enzyme family protein [Desertimonas flava]|uniref:class I adenylate-forming enzyme family protein n=1 Tax=Desertimonas flava TaxID=2064846 RepID=UPI0013C4F265|nr:AMP-binding protein [Desertimonas flava]
MTANGLDYQADLSVADLAGRHARRFHRRDAEAVVCGSDRRTWRELDRRVRGLADGLIRRGVEPDDVIAVFSSNRVEFFEIVLATATIGAVVAPQSFRSSLAELEHGIDATGAKVLIAESTGDLAGRTAAIAASRPQLDVLDLEACERLIARGDPTVERTPPAEGNAFWLALTGGTTGPPKLVRVPHRVIVQMWLYMVIEFEIGARDTMLVAGPLHHGLGFGFALQQLYVGGRVVVLPHFDARGVLAAIESSRATVLPAAPTMLTLMLDAWDEHPTDLSSLRTVISAGSSLPVATKQRLATVAPKVALYEHYGATEAGFFTVLGPEDAMRKPRSCGEAFFGTTVTVLRDDGSAADVGEVGHVAKRGLVQGGGYVRNVAATAKMFRDGWASVGDLGYVDEEGYVFLVDRSDDMIVSGGVNVYPAEIEAAIEELAGVSAVAVIGVPDERWGELVKAFVVVRPGHQVDERAVVDACTSRLAAYKRPRLVEFVDELPISAAGKVLKRLLRER